MDEQVALRLQAAALRRQGYSLSQIGRRLNIHKSVVARWVADVPFEGWSAESRAERLQTVRDPDLHARARDLRRAGWSYPMIEAELGVARSTLNGWLRDIPLSEDRRRAHLEQAQRKAHQANAARQQALRDDISRTAHDELQALLPNGLDTQQLFIAGLMLYWAEGAKTGTVVSMTNSDPSAIQLFVVWVDRYLDTHRDQLRGEVHLYPDTNVDEAENYWSDVIGVPRTQFYKAQVDRRTTKVSSKRRTLPYGTVHVKIVGRGTTNKLRKILAWIDHFCAIMGDATRE